MKRAGEDGKAQGLLCALREIPLAFRFVRMCGLPPCLFFKSNIFRGYLRLFRECFLAIYI